MNPPSADPALWSGRHASADLCRHFGVTTLEVFGLGDLAAGLSAGAAALAYVRATQGERLGHLTRLQRLRPDEVTEKDRHEYYQGNAPRAEAGLYVVPKVIE